MFGQNPIRKIEHSPEDGKLAIQNVFYTIQGEGPFAGCAAVFIRLAGCHLACTFCDTEFESGITNRMTPGEVVTAALNSIPSGVKLMLSGYKPMVVMTGGEPLRQKTGPLVGLLLDAGFAGVQYETAGNLWDQSLLPWLGDPQLKVLLVVSPKTPHVHPMVHRYARHWKYIVREGDSDPTDGLPITPTQRSQPVITRLFRPWDVSLASRPHVIWVSPCDAHEEAQNRANQNHAVKLCLERGYRLSLQTHKIIGVA